MFEGIIQCFIVAMAQAFVPNNLSSTGIQVMKEIVMCVRVQEVIGKYLQDDKFGS